jgi:hypothetical protein
MPRHIIPDVFELPDQREGGNPLPWLTALAMAVIVIGATLALVMVSESATSPDPQVTVSR